MDINFLFSTFPFISDENMTLSQLYFSDEENLTAIFKENKITENTGRYIELASKAFNAKRYVEIGYYRKNQPNFLLGTLCIKNIDVNTNSVQVSIVYSSKDLDAAALALITLCKFLFNQIEVSKITCEKIEPEENWNDIMVLCNFVKEGQIRKCVLNSNAELSDLHIYGLFKDEFPEKYQERIFDTDIFTKSLDILDIVDEVNHMEEN